MNIETIVFIALSLMNGSAIISIFFSERKPSSFGIALAVIALVILSLMVRIRFIGENKINPAVYKMVGLPFLLYGTITLWDVYSKDNIHTIMIFINKMYILWISVVYAINSFSHYLFDK